MSIKNNEKRFCLPKTKIWALHKSSTRNRYYYYNIITGKAFWERPKDLKDDEINFPEGIPLVFDDVCQTINNSTKPVEESPKNVNHEKTVEKNINPKKTVKRNKKKQVIRGKQRKKVTANLPKDSEDSAEQCKSSKSGRQLSHEARKKNKEMLFKDKPEPELPDYTDSEDDQPSTVSRDNTTDNEANKLQSKGSGEKFEDSKVPDFDARRIGGILFKLNEELEPMDWTPSTENEFEEIQSESVNTEWQYLENEVIPMEIDETTQDDTFVVIDTNIIIRDSALLESLTHSELDDGSKINVILPWQVLQELDHLKHNLKGLPATHCRNAIRFIRSCFSNKSSNMIVQNSVSEKLCSELIKIVVPDDNILACCLQIIGIDRKTILLTDDLNLCNKASAHNIEAYTKIEFIPKLSNRNQKSLPGIEKNNNCVGTALQNGNRMKANDSLITSPLAITRPISNPSGYPHKCPLTERTAYNEGGPFSGSSCLHKSSPNKRTALSESITIKVPGHKEELPYSVVRNMMPRKYCDLSFSQNDKKTGIPGKALGTLSLKRPNTGSISTVCSLTSEDQTHQSKKMKDQY